MHILHGTWIPQSEEGFVQSGGFYLWVETTTKKRFKKSSDRHPYQLTAEELGQLLEKELGIKPKGIRGLLEEIDSRYFVLPSVDQQPLPSLELSRYLETELPDKFDWRSWQIDCYPAAISSSGEVYGYKDVNTVAPLLNDLHFLAIHKLTEIQFGADLLFWFHFTQALKRIIFKDQYIPALKYRQLVKEKKRSSKPKTLGDPSKTYDIYPGWEFIGEEYESLVEQFIDYMPMICVAGFEAPQSTAQFYEREMLLRHFSDCLLSNLMAQTRLTKAIEKKLENSLLSDCLSSRIQPLSKSPTAALAQYQQWQAWRDRIVRTQTKQPFLLYFHLQDPAKPDDPWALRFQIAPKNDPSLRLTLEDYWRMRPQQQVQVKEQMGKDFEQNLLLNLGYAARIYPALWQGLETDEPVGIFLDLDAAFTFLKETAWVLENAGYKVVVPAWWTPQGRRRAKVRLKAKSSSLGGDSQGKSYFSWDKLVKYQYELAIGDDKINQEEWEQLIATKTPLVNFRGQWIELDQEKMQQMLAFWQTQQAENPEMSLLDFLKMTSAGQGDDELEVEYEREDRLADMLANIGNKHQLQLIENPQHFQGSLREYQKRGVSWVQYLEDIGLNGCLADDMGLGKTVQVIARLLQERESFDGQQDHKIPPTLLIAPTSVVGNWFHELGKFAPQLKAMIHHGSDRLKEAKNFKKACREHDIIITSFALARKDAKLVQDINWHRVVLDEAQNIKNPKAALTKSILKLSAQHRLALTGTPIENRLLDLWSIFNFLNPGYLGTQAQFRKGFEVPIQRNNNRQQSLTLKKLVEPFILRRVKTDKSIIKDLPDKVEQKLFCNLTKEQGSLYEVVVKEAEKELKTVEGMKRKGLILGTLTRLKQICNHPRQFLQDESDFSVERSHKLARLTEMVEEVIDEEESLLIFTQFTELGDAIAKYFKQHHHYNTYYLHGGTTRKKRESMISQFQNPETEPSLFVLSLKAGGVGITLTKANHVFHFDRWWNPSVEDQATDRAFRIGQEKNVFVHKFVALGTLEERIDEMIEDKKKLAGSIVGSDESWLTELDNDAFRDLISLNKSTIID